MTPNQIINLAQKRVKDSSSDIEWNIFYSMAIDRVFRKKPYKFARQELNYIHSASVANKTFSATALEKALNKIIQMRFTTSYTLVGGVPVPASGTVQIIDYLPVSEFRELYLDNIPPGLPIHYTILTDNDGTNGMTIALGPIPNASAAIWIDGDFIPSYTINSSPMPILPLQFHGMVVEGVVYYAALDKGQKDLAAVAKAEFNEALAELDLWDLRNSKNRPVLQPYAPGIRKGPFFPSNFERPFSR